MTAPPPEFNTSIRLPPHRLEIDEARFLRLLASCASLHQIEKRLIIRNVPRFSQYRVDALIRILEDELREQERQNALDPNRRQAYERVREQELAEWRELERELGR